ncbi:probable cytochrome P450 6a14 [Drosophila kikkawai]|uniref:Probable cytochrome P450 6a14 n=1 Tax=Drosophila kikkawai TaxID=30033 RepID=A0A6P4IAD4_DROKI|nr:probable cytochrome P450 6a14 [Drosophila kikkawai]
MDFVLLVLTSLLSFLLGYLRYRFGYWEQRGVPQLKANFLVGHLAKLRSVHLSELLQETYDAFRGSALVAGTYVYLQPVAVALDLDLVKSVLIRDFGKFADRRSFHGDPLTNNLFNMQGEEWRSLRTKLTPTFTSGKMKYMFGTITAVAQQLGETFEELVGSQGNVLELHDLLGRYTTDVIGNCAFGTKCNSLKDPQTEFRRVGRQLFQKGVSSIRWRIFKFTYLSSLSKLGLPVRIFAPEVTEFFMRIVRETVELREREQIRRNDFMDLLLGLRRQENGKEFTVEQMAAQAFVFFVAGFETSSSNMSYALFELAKNEAVQQKLRREIREVIARHGQLTYEAMMEMPYLDQTITETLRKYPALASLTRVASEDYEIPARNGGEPIVLEKGTNIHIPVRAIHYDPEIYPEPDEFRPERFEPAACQERPAAAFLGFGDGPRNCIGLRFGRMQVKVGLITLLLRFRFRLPSGSPEKLMVTRRSIILMPDKGVRLQVDRLEAEEKQCRA